jgi:transcriptional regulator with XRE-family HTH domain
MWAVPERILYRKSVDETRGQRMVRLRKAMATTQAEFLSRYGFKRSSWSGYEHGIPIGLGAAIQLVHEIPGLTLDWIYLGTSRGLSLKMARRLGELEPPPDTTSG